MKQNRLTLVVASLVVIVLLLQMMVYTVKDSEAAVLLTFGKPTAETHEPGLGFKWPWPIQEVKYFDARLRVLEVPLEQMLTADGQPVLVGSFALWRVSSAKTFQAKFDDLADAETQIESSLRNHQSAVISSVPFGGLISADPAQLRYEEVEARMTQGVSVDVASFGIEVQLVGVRRLSLPQSATEAVFERMRADRRRMATAIREEGKEKADAIRRKAEEERSKLLVQAEKEARALLTQADREASPHYAEMAKDPELAIFLKKVEALEELLDRKTTLVLDSRQPPFDLLTPREGAAPGAGDGK